MKYKTGEYPKYGDLVRGVPNRSNKVMAGIVIATYDEAICVCVPFLRPTGVVDSVRIYGEAGNFELLARNELEATL